MKTLFKVAVLGSLLLSVVADLPGIANDQRTLVIVELFTSEGCSSCPPADELLARLQKKQPIAGAEILALEQHVDYWDRLGWRDPYSSPAFTARQQQYNQMFRNTSIYTPQMVVDGSVEFVGSDAHRAFAAIAEAARSHKATVRLARAGNPAVVGPGRAVLSVRIENLARVNSGDRAEVFLAITEDSLSSNVSRGENAGRELSHAAVVRKLDVIGVANSQEASAFTGERVVQIERGWKQEHLRAVVFVQERGTRRVLGAAATTLAPE